MRNPVYPNTVANQSLGQARRPMATATKTIPFDYVFQFTLNGVRGNKVQDVVEISMEGVFVALSVGYSLVLDERKTPRTFQPEIDRVTTSQNPVVVPFFDGTNLPRGIFVAGMPGADIAILDLTEGVSSPPPRIARMERIGPDGIVKVDLPIPLSSIHRVWDRTNNLLSQTFEVIPPTLAFPVSTPVIGPHPTTKRLPAAGETTVYVYGSRSSTVGVYLLSSATTIGDIQPVNGSPFPLEDVFRDVDPFWAGTSRAVVRLDGPLAPGDVLLLRTEGEPGPDPFSMFTIPRPRLSTITLGELAAGLERSGTDLTRGFRLNPNFASLITADAPLDQLAPGTLERIFETGCVAAEEVSFLYSLDVTGTGREYQNKAIHNIAGLGIANGDRPFRPFAKPVMFEPRSFIRIQVEEISGPPGTLFIVLQGYKILGTGRIPG
ncbi:MAG: hypothetical protein MOB07_31285 [Acidobacteria bacterium]|nr:hypothetical protein [Acidobacteriota bacterium]